MATILIADGSRLLQRNLTLTLQGAGYDLMLASDGMELLSLCTKRVPDLLLLDCHLPGMPVKEVLRLIRLTPGIEGTPILLLASDEKSLKTLRLMGTQDHLFKPIETRQLLQRVNSLLAPMPGANQSMTIRQDPNPFTVNILRIFPGRLAQVELPLLGNFAPQNVLQVEYEVPGGARVSRDAVVQAVAEDSLTLALGASVQVEQRRRHFRKTVSIPVRYRIPGDFFRLAHTLDISGGGMRVTDMSGALEEGLALDFQLVLNPSIILPISGIVRRIISAEGGRHDVGIEFVTVDPSIQQELTVFLFAGLPITQAE